MASIFARVTYDYKGRYLLNAIMRRDGSSRFAKENKWGNFPSVSVGWRFSDEKFMKFSKKFLEDGKIRRSHPHGHLPSSTRYHLPYMPYLQTASQYG